VPSEGALNQGGKEEGNGGMTMYCVSALVASSEAVGVLASAEGVGQQCVDQACGGSQLLVARPA